MNYICCLSMLSVSSSKEHEVLSRIHIPNYMIGSVSDFLIFGAGPRPTADVNITGQCSIVSSTYDSSNRGVTMSTCRQIRQVTTGFVDQIVQFNFPSARGWMSSRNQHTIKICKISRFYVTSDIQVL